MSADKAPALRYVHGSWEHYFTNGRRLVRFAYDTDEERVVAAQVMVRERWLDASRTELLDIEDSLKHGNEEALDQPKDYGLTASASPPGWCPKAPEAVSHRRRRLA